MCFLMTGVTNMVEKNEQRYPSIDDLKQRIKFSPDTGHIWLGEQRMLLLHCEAMGSLRRELVETLGVERAKGIIMRTGYRAGIEDAKLAKNWRPDANERDQFLVGPQLHQLEGMVRVANSKLEMDISKKQFYMELDWENSYESEVHQKTFGPSEDPVCWMEVGYASGYSSEFTGQPILFVEKACCACGDDYCTIIGKPLSEWDNAKELNRHYESNSIVDQFLNLRDEVVQLKSSLDEHDKEDDAIIGVSKSFKESYELLDKAVQGPVTVLLLGETGVGKELFARSLHRKSERAEQPFIAVNCAAIPEDLLEAELFGVEKGAYTGAHQSRQGRFERANGGTLFLDEIGDLAYSAQAKLLRVLQEGELERVGGGKVISVDVRVVAATHTNLAEKVDLKQFRQDLFYRLNVYPIVIPPLRERQGDIALLADNFINQYKAKYHKDIKGITDHAMVRLEAYRWPGNIRELENVIERGVLLCDNGGQVELQHLFAMMDIDEEPELGLGNAGQLQALKKDSYHQFVDIFFKEQHNLFDLEETILKEAVKRAEGNLSGAARMLNMTRPQLAYRLSKLGQEK